MLFNNDGGDGNGYSGIQQSGTKQNLYIFSLWHPANNQTITAPYIYPGTVFQNFGNEGTGKQTLNTQLGWTVGQWYTLFLRRWDGEAGHTNVGFWVHKITENQWVHLVTIDYPVGSVYFRTKTASFLEDWQGTGQNVRRFEMKNGYKRANNTWIPFSKQLFFTITADTLPGKRSFKYKNAFDAGVSNGAYYMQTGGNTKTSKNCVSGSCDNIQVATPSRPAQPPIVFSISSISPVEVDWVVPISSTPQFRYTILFDGVVQASNIDPEARSFTFPETLNAVVTVTLEDIFGNGASQQMAIPDLDPDNGNNGDSGDSDE